ncbi:MAG: SDR family oxidoreductase [Thermoanaerobaculia bacterium]
MPAFELDGRVALVTGASGGIGSRIAVTLAASGARVAIHYHRSEAGAAAVAAEIENAGGPTPVLVAADLADVEARRALHATVSNRLGAPAILVHNAALYSPETIADGDDTAFLKRWRATMNVNLEATAHLTFLALGAMRAARYGRIVMVSSRAAFRGELTCADYAVSKAGMVNFARSLARSEGPFGITTNSVCPGWVATEMAAPDLAAFGDDIRAEIPLGRVAAPQDVANAVLFFASSLGSYANGTALGLNGGSFLH